MKIITTAFFPLLLAPSLLAADPLIIAFEADWKKSIASSEGVVIKNGVAEPTGKTGTLRTRVHKFDQKRSASSFVIR